MQLSDGMATYIVVSIGRPADNVIWMGHSDPEQKKIWKELQKMNFQNLHLFYAHIFKDALKVDKTQNI